MSIFTVAKEHPWIEHVLQNSTIIKEAKEPGSALKAILDSASRIQKAMTGCAKLQTTSRMSMHNIRFLSDDGITALFLTAMAKEDEGLLRSIDPSWLTQQGLEVAIEEASRRGKEALRLKLLPFRTQKEALKLPTSVVTPTTVARPIKGHHAFRVVLLLAMAVIVSVMTPVAGFLK